MENCDWLSPDFNTWLNALNQDYHFRIFHTIKKPQNPVQVQFSAKTTTPKRAKQANESNLIGV